MTTQDTSTISFDVRNRWSGDIQITAQIECSEDTPLRVKLGLAVKWAVKTRADLGGADLRGAYLRGANLGCADLRGAYLSGANLGCADLRGADLCGAYLGGAYLRGADLCGAYLCGAYLSGAYLSGAKWDEGVLLTQEPVQISGLTWPVTILDTHMQIGCELHSHEDWAAFDDRRIAQMDGAASARFWRDHRDWLLGLCASHAAKTADESGTNEAA